MAVNYGGFADEKSADANLVALSNVELANAMLVREQTQWQLGVVKTKVYPAEVIEIKSFKD